MRLCASAPKKHKKLKNSRRIASSGVRSKAVGDLKCVGGANEAALNAVESLTYYWFSIFLWSVSHRSKLLSGCIYVI